MPIRLPTPRTTMRKTASRMRARGERYCTSDVVFMINYNGSARLFVSPFPTWKNGMTADRRLTGVDFLRAIACLMVVIHHLIFRLDSSKAPEWAKPLLQFGVNGSFGVAIFFA